MRATVIRKSFSRGEASLVWTTVLRDRVTLANAVMVDLEPLAVVAMAVVLVLVGSIPLLLLILLLIMWVQLLSKRWRPDRRLMIGPLWLLCSE